MADISRVLQALGAVSSGVGNTILSIEEQRRRREEEEERKRFREQQAQIQQAQLARQGVTLPDEQGTVPGPLTAGPGQGADVSGITGGGTGIATPGFQNRTGERVEAQNLPANDPRQPLGNSDAVFDPRVAGFQRAAVEEQAEALAFARARERARDRILPLIEDHPSFQGLDDETQEFVESMILEGELPNVETALDFIVKTDEEQKRQISNDVAFDRLNSILVEEGKPPLGTDPIEGVNYRAILTNKISAKVARVPGGDSRGLTPLQELNQKQQEALGEATRLVRGDNARFDIVFSELKRKFPSLDDGILTLVIDKAFESQLTPNPRTGVPASEEPFFDPVGGAQGVIQGTPDSPRGSSRAMDLLNNR